jgi:DUF2914 family protein
MKNTTLVILAAIVMGIGSAEAAETTPPALPAGQAGAPPAAAPAAPAAPAVVKVEKIAIGTAIDNKEISGEAASFDSTVTRVYAWTKVTTDQTPVTIKHVWSADGKEEASVPLEIKYNAARTWSSKAVWPGSWKVDVQDDQGKVLVSKEFTVSKEAAPPASPAGAPPAKAPPPPQVGQ